MPRFARTPIFHPLLSALGGLALALLLPSYAGAGAEENGPLVLAEEGKALAAVVLPQSADAALRDCAGDFVRTVERATGAKLPVLEEGAASGVPAGVVRVYVGPTRQSREAGLSADALPEEGYRIVTRGGSLFVLGRGNGRAEGGERTEPASRPARWALDSILETQLGVRWLWPGELGTYVPKAARLSVPATDVTYQPKLVKRGLWLPLKDTRNGTGDAESRRIEQEAFDWAENHQVGKHGSIGFGHAFGHWWKKYSAEHPDYFGETLPGHKQPYPRPERAKLRLSNPAVIEQIAREYEAAGAPAFWNVCPNDGSGFDVSEATRAWDIPQNQPAEAIWTAKANLTGRYVEFWNRLSERLRQVNPEVTLCTYAYSAYKSPPPAERPLTARMAIALVPLYYDYDLWQGWGATGSKLFLRPNWFHYGGSAPYLPLEESARFLKFAWASGLAGIDMDSIMGYWATQGAHYYLVARMMTRPELSLEEILGEYTSAFGAARPKIREYLAYWQALSSKYKYGAPDGEFQKLVEEGKLGPTLARGSRQALLHLYPEEVIAPGRKLLAEAKALLPPDDAESRARVEFLESGLEELAATRELLRLGFAIRQHSTSELAEAFDRQSRVLLEIRKRLSPSHAVWGAAATANDNRRTVFIKPIGPLP